jgi:hypothetical protein
MFNKKKISVVEFKFILPLKKSEKQILGRIVYSINS